MDYKAFISYSHAADGNLAPALQSALSSFAKPWYRLRSMRVFRDQTNLSANPALWPSIERALSQSEFFLLLASPGSARSRWVEREVVWWLEHHSIEKMLIILTDGELVWDETANDFDWERTTALPASLRGRFKSEPLYVDFRLAKVEKVLSLRSSRFRGNVLDVAATLLGKDKDTLDGEDVRQYRRNRRWAWAAVIALSLMTVIAIVWAYQAIRNGNIATENARNALARQLAAQSELLTKEQLNPQSGVSLALASLKTQPTFSGDQAIYHSLSMMAPLPTSQRTYTGLVELVLSPHGKYLVQIPYEGPATVEDGVTGQVITDLINLDQAGKPEPAIRKVVFSADEQRVATMSSLGMSTYVWDLPTGKVLFHTSAERTGVIAIAMSDDGRYLATGHTDGRVYVWDISSGAEVLSLTHEDTPWMLQLSHDGNYLAVSSSLGLSVGSASISMVRLWNVEGNKEIAQLQHVSAVTHMAFSPDEKYLATTSYVGQEQDVKDRVGKVTIWESSGGKAVSSVQHEQGVETLSFTRDGNNLLTGSSDDTARLWDAASGEQLLRIEQGSTVNTAGFLKVGDYSYIVTAGGDGMLRMWVAGTPTMEWMRLEESPQSLAYAQTADGQYVVAISRNLNDDVAVGPHEYRRDVRVWSVASVQAQLRLQHDHNVGGIRFSPDSRHLATFDFQEPTSQVTQATTETEAAVEYTGSGSGSASVWDVVTHKRLSHMPHPCMVLSVQYDATGKYLASACADGIARVWDAQSGKQVAALEREGWAIEIAFSPDGRYLAVSSGDPALLGGEQGDALITLWEWQTGKEMWQMHNGYLMSALDYSPDGKQLAVGGYDGTVHILQVADGQELRQLHHEYPVWKLAYSPDGTSIVVASGGTNAEHSPQQNGETTLWKLADGSKQILREHQSWALSVAFSPNGEFVASIDRNGWLGVWTTVGNKEILTVKHNESVAQTEVHFSQDSNYLIAAVGNKAQVWNVATRQEVARREHEVGYLWDARFSPDGKYLATAGTDTTAGLWHWQPEDLIQDACARLPRNLTRAEWRQYVGSDVPYQAACDGLGTPAD
jgi:WD40 repeat protein